VSGRGDADPPARPLRRRIADGQIAAALDHRPRKPLRPQRPQRLLRGEALGHAAEINPHIGLQQLGGALGRVEPQQPMAGDFAGGLEPVGVG